MLRLVHVGLGGWGRNWEATALPPVKEVEGVAWVDADEDTLGRAQQQLRLPDDRCFGDLDSALGSVDADAVLVTAPVDAHVPLAIEALRAGKHVLVEKPFSSGVAEARRAVDTAAEVGRVLMVSQNYRFYPAVRTATQLVREQALGPVGSVRIDFRKWANSAEAGTSRHYRLIHPLLFDMAIHHFDLMRRILGREPSRVFTQVADPPWSKFVQEAAATVVAVFGDGSREIVVSYRGSWVSPGTPTTWAGDWHLECERGEIFWTGRSGNGTDDDVVSARRIGEADAEPVAQEPMSLWGRSAAVAAFVEAIESGEEPETSGRRNLGSLALMEAAARSAASGEVEPVESVDGLEGVAA